MIRVLAGLCALCMLGFAVDATAQVYKWTDANGVVHFSDTPPAKGKAATVAIDPYVPPDGYQAPGQAANTGTRQGAKRQALSIQMYATSHCPYCRCAREVFQSRGVRWQELDIEKSAAVNREFRSRGGTGVPLIFMNGERHVGCNRTSLAAALARYGY